MPSHKPIISVILPVYNGAEYLDFAVRSILGQSFEDFELLICDDGSSDGTTGMVRDFEQQDSRIRAVYRHTNAGISSALNELVARARGKFIARMDADDISLPNRLAMQLEEFPRGDDAVVSFAALERIDKDGNRIGGRTPPPDDFRFHLRFGNPFIHPLLFSRTRVLQSFKYRDIPYAEDYDLYVRMVLAGVDFHVSKQVLLRHRTLHSQTRDPQRLYTQLISTLWIREQFSKGELSVNPAELEQTCRQFDFQHFLEKWPTYNSCLGEPGNSNRTRLKLLLNYARLDPLVRADVRNTMRYLVASLFR